MQIKYRGFLCMFSSISILNCQEFVPLSQKTCPNPIYELGKDTGTVVLYGLAGATANLLGAKLLASIVPPENSSDIPDALFMGLAAATAVYVPPLLHKTISTNENSVTNAQSIACIIGIGLGFYYGESILKD